MSQLTAQAKDKVKKSTPIPNAKQVLSMSIPMLGLMLCHLGISLSDLWACGQIDASAQAALAIVSQIFMLIMLITSIAGSGCLASVSQALGAGNADRAKRYAGLIIKMAFIAGSFVGAVAYLLLPQLMRILNVPEELKPVVQGFCAAYCLQLPFYYCMILMNSVYRAHKLIWQPLFAILAVLISNTLGNMAFGLGWWGFPAFGYTGIAWSTFGATIIGLSLNIAYGIKKGILCRKAFAPWKWNKRAMPYIFKVGVPAALGQLATQGGSLLLLALVNALPQDSVEVLAGMSLGMRVQSIALFPLGAVGLTMSVFSGHLLGASQGQALYDLAKRWAWRCGLFFLIPGLLLILLRFELSAFFSQDSNVVLMAGQFLIVSSACLPLQAYTSVLNGVFAGAGATRQSCIAGIFSMWIVQIPLAAFLALTMELGAFGVFMAIPLSSLAGAICLNFIFNRKKWLECGFKKRQTKAA